MNKHQMNQKTYPVTYNLFGIYVDWQIDNYQIFNENSDINGISSLNCFLEMKGWKVVEIMLEDEKMITLDLEFPKLIFLNMLGIQPERVLEDKMCAAGAEKALISHMKESKLPYFDIFEYYMDNAPWNLKGGTTYNKPPTRSQNPNMLVEIDTDFFDKRIIVKVMTEKGEERVTSVNDICNGEVLEHELLIDATCYDDETSLLMEQSWSEKLGIPVLQNDETIDLDYKYHTE